jgi:predicted dehydrogenase
MGATVGVALVGLGSWGPSHLRVLQESDQAALRWICDTDPDRVERLARRTSAATATDLGRVLEDGETQAVILATPISTHFELACRCLEAGKHVLVEKPLAASSREAVDLIQLARDRGLAVMCAHTDLFSPPVRAIAELISEGALGELHFISSSVVGLGLDPRDVSVLWDLAPDDFSILLDWLGEMPESVSAVGRGPIVGGTPDVAFVNLTYAGGSLANVEMSRLAPSRLRRTVVVGAEKMVVHEDGSPEPVRIFDHAGDIVSPRVPTEQPLAVQLREFIDAVRRGRGADRHLRLARDVVELVETAEDSLQSGGIRIPVRDFRVHDLRDAALGDRPAPTASR